MDIVRLEQGPPKLPQPEWVLPHDIPPKLPTAPDHLYYHPELFSSQAELDGLFARRRVVQPFFYEIADEFQKRERVLRAEPLPPREEPLVDRVNYVDPKLKQQVEAQGLLTPQELRLRFEEFKDEKRKELVDLLLKDQAADKTKEVAWDIQHLAHNEQMTLHDAWLYGTWIADWQTRGLKEPEVGFDNPKVVANLDQVVTLFEDAMEMPAQHFLSPVEKPPSSESGMLLAKANTKPPDDVPDHPYWNAAYSKEKAVVLDEIGDVFYTLGADWRKRGGPLTPLEVKTVLEQWKIARMAPEQRKLEDTDKQLKAILDISLYDVWAYATYEIEAQLSADVEEGESPNLDWLQLKDKYQQMAEVLRKAHTLYEAAEGSSSAT